MGISEEERNRVKETGDKPAEDVFEGVSDADLAKAYKEDKKDEADEDKKKWAKLKGKVVEEQDPYERRVQR